MGFFQSFSSWLTKELSTYIGTNTALVAAILEPAMVTCGTLYVMAWGYLHLTGRIEEPFTTGLKRIVTLAVILGVGLQLWLYNDILVDTFYTAPAEFAAAVVGATDPVQTIDAIWNQGGGVAAALWTRGVWGLETLGFKAVAAVVWILVGFLCVYTMFLIALSKVALAVLLAVGPLFITMCLFERTRRLFDAWLAQLTNYALVTVLTVMVASLLLQLMASYSAQTAALGVGLSVMDPLNLLLAAALVLLMMRQVLPIAAGLAGGVALTSFGLVGRSVSLPLRAVKAVKGAISDKSDREKASAARNSEANTARTNS
jgi:type IV secretion system protein VirB6